MRTTVVNLPSGASVELRQVTIREENILASQVEKRSDARKRAAVITDVLSACTVRAVDPGPYPFLEPDGRADWRRMLRGDQWWALLQLRKLTYRDGGTFDMDITCRNRPCGNRWTEDIDIDRDLPLIRLSADGQRRVAEGAPFECSVAGRRVTFRLPTGEVDKNIERLLAQFPGRRMAAVLRARIEDVEDVDRKDIMNWLDGGDPARPLRSADARGFDPLTSDDAEDLRDALDAADCGVETSIPFDCPECGTPTEVEVPFDRLLLPGRGARARRRAALAEKRREMEERTEATTEATTPDTTGSSES